jgi:hypothetical protein
MGWDQLAAICSLFGVVATVTGVAFTSGRLSEKIRENRDRVLAQAEMLEKHSARLDNHTLRVDRLEQWREGFNAAACISGGGKISTTDRLDHG